RSLVAMAPILAPRARFESTRRDHDAARIKFIPTTIASPCDGRRDRTLVRPLNPRLSGRSRPKPGAKTRLTARLDSIPALAPNPTNRPYQGPTTAVKTFTRNSNLRSNHAKAGKQVNRRSQHAQLRSSSLTSAGRSCIGERCSATWATTPVKVVKKTWRENAFASVRRCGSPEQLAKE